MLDKLRKTIKSDLIVFLSSLVYLSDLNVTILLLELTDQPLGR